VRGGFRGRGNVGERPAHRGEGFAVRRSALQLVDRGRGHVEQPQAPEAHTGGRHDQVYRRVFGEAVPGEVRHRVQRRTGGLVGEGGDDALGEGRGQPPDHRRGHGRDLGGGR